VGTSRSTAEFVKKINDIGHATDRSRRAVVSDGALTAKKLMLAAAATRGVTPGGKIAGKKWGVSYNVVGTETPSALVRFTGPFHLVNNPTKAHQIVPGGRGGRRRSRKRALNIPGIGPRAYATHPGTPGKFIFQAAKPIAHRTVPQVMAASMKGAWRRALR
jgi:hypothetical protein